MENDYRKRLDSLRADYRHAQRQVKEEEQARVGTRQEVETAQQAQQIFQEVAQRIQENCHKQIASVVSRCLEAVFGEEAPEFRIDFRKARGKTEARLLFARDGHEMDPIDSSGGGVIDVTSMALRLACLLLSLPRRRRLLILDEPMKMLSKQYVPAVQELFLALSKELDIQIIMVTHNPELQIGKVIEI